MSAELDRLAQQSPLAEALARGLFTRRPRPLQRLVAEIEERRRFLEDEIAAGAAELAAINRMLEIASEPVTLVRDEQPAALAPDSTEVDPPPAPATAAAEPSPSPAADPALDFASYCPHCGTGDPGDDYCASCGEALGVLPEREDDERDAQDEPALPEPDGGQDEAPQQTAPDDASTPAADASPAPRRRELSRQYVLVALDELAGQPATVARICRQLGREGRGRPHSTVGRLIEELVADGLVEQDGTWKTGPVWRRVASAVATPDVEPSPDAAARDDASSTSATEPAEQPRCWCTDMRAHPRCPVHKTSPAAAASRDPSPVDEPLGVRILDHLSLCDRGIALAVIAETLGEPRSAVEIELRQLLADEAVIREPVNRYRRNPYA